MSLSAIDYQIMWTRLIAVVEEQAMTLVRTAFSTSVREAGDLSAGLFDRQARMIAQAVTGTPGHVNAMAESVAHFVRGIGPQNIFEGDVYITNDPWLGTGHLHDITMVTPVFRQGVHIGYFASTAHVVDIGGRGFGPDAGEVYEEGLLIPISKFIERGRVDETLLRILRANVRTPDQTVGDIYSLAACNDAGERRLQAMLDEFGVDVIDGLADYIVDTSARATRAAIEALPEGRFVNEMRVDGYDAPVTMRVALSVDGDRLVADFAGTSAMSAFGVNVPEIYTRAYACYGLKCAIAPEVPNNAGSLAPFEITAPEGSILAATRPAAVSVRHVLGHLVPDVVLGALHRALPDIVPAEGASALWNIQISARPADPASRLPPGEVLMFNSGGTGARPLRDGLSATAFPSGVSTMSVEATEAVGPITVWRKELRPGSGGAGRQRGGLGQIIEIAPNEGYELHFNAMFDRVDNPARGREGGGPGAPGKVERADGTQLRAKGRQRIGEGARLKLSLPGGGGYGAPEERARAEVLADLEAGYVSPREAREVYGLDDAALDALQAETSGRS
ncbi:MAG: hydantoinase B/oxoprolinase family protein [Paracoccaceae bacterium]|nr:hydantoinase B/oxoprolinase family protein [Paracoccaceae bacterium]